ncbi:MAG: Ger(x)C family spore germination protein [Clostridia bacterium]
MFKKIITYITIFLFLFLSLISLSGCSYQNTIDDLAYVVALGLDIGESNNLKLSFQVSIPSSGGDSGQSSSSQSSDSVINSIECTTIDSGLNIINSYISKKINLSHCKVIVFSEALAYQGISKYIYTLLNDIEVRPDCNIIVSKCSASYFLKNSKPTLEKLTARYYEIAPKSSEYTGYTSNVTINDFFSNLNDTMVEPYAILGNVNTQETQKQNEKSSFDKDSSYTAGETPIESRPNAENMGLAVFYGDRLVGELNGIETICYLILTNQLKTCNINIPSPFDKDTTIDLSLKVKNRTKNKVEFINNSPFITCKVSLNAEILSMNKDSEYLEDKNLKEIEEAANRYLESHISDYLYKTAQEFRSDITGFGKYAVSQFPTWDKWSTYNWLDNYCNSFFQVHSSISIRSSHLLIKT